MMDHPNVDIAVLILKKLSITSIRQLYFVNKYWYNFLKHRLFGCRYHDFHCKKCRSSIFKSSKKKKSFHLDKTIDSCLCLNANVIKSCNYCNRTFCKHLTKKKCKKCKKVYDRNPNICGLCCSKCIYCAN